MTVWKARSVRLTIFLPPEAISLAKELNWEHLGGAEPENVMKRGDRETQDGPFGVGRLVLQKQPGRIDVVLAGVPQVEGQDDPVATLGPFEQAYNTFRPVVQAVLETVKPQLRVALGTELVRPVRNVGEAYKVLIEHMNSASFNLDGGQEFIYQINRPRPSQTVKGLLLNRLTRWNASSWQPVTFEIAANTQVLKGEPKYGAAITTDVNTDGERTVPLPSETMTALFDELRDLTAEIRDKGDVR